MSDRVFVVDRSGGPARLEFFNQLAELMPLESTLRISCSHLEIQADFVNVFDCTLALRYAGTEKWNMYSIADQRCSNESELVTAIQAVESKFRLDRWSGGGARIWMQPYAGQATEVEFKFNRSLALLLGVDAERVFSGVVPAQPDVHALVRHINVSSSQVYPYLSVNSSQISSLGAFKLAFDADGRQTSCRKILNQRASFLPDTTASLNFSLTSLHSPSSVIRVETFRILACFVID